MVLRLNVRALSIFLVSVMCVVVIAGLMQTDVPRRLKFTYQDLSGSMAGKYEPADVHDADYKPADGTYESSYEPAKEPEFEPSFTPPDDPPHPPPEDPSREPPHNPPHDSQGPHNEPGHGPPGPPPEPSQHHNNPALADYKQPSATPSAAQSAHTNPPVRGKVYAETAFPSSMFEGTVPYVNEVERFHREGGFLKYPLSIEQTLPADVNLEPSESDPTKTVFMFRSDKSSTYTDIFAVQKDAVQVCDKDTKISGCTYRLPNNYDWETLSVKLVDTIKMFCVSPHKTDIYIKIDDDVIMPESELDRLARMLHFSPTCHFAGMIATDFTFYWGEGKIYMFTRDMLNRACANIPTLQLFHASEDVTMGQMINSTKTEEFCVANDSYQYWHKKYKDQRVDISYDQIH